MCAPELFGDAGLAARFGLRCGDEDGTSAVSSSSHSCRFDEHLRVLCFLAIFVSTTQFVGGGSCMGRALLRVRRADVRFRVSVFSDPLASRC
jgi:hypothetical protein